MKVFISADIEGVAGITRPEEANPERADIRYFQERMTAEVAAACRGAMKAGATSIVVKDAHWTGCNIDPRVLPETAAIVRGWTGHPYHMMQGLDDGFDAVMYVGYHARAGSGGNPLAHTLSGGTVHELRINGKPMSEFMINTYTAQMLGVPVVFLSGDQDLCAEVKAYHSEIVTYATMQGIGTGTVSVHPEVAVREIEARAYEAMQGDLKSKLRRNPDRFEIDIEYVRPRVAYGKSFFPGAELKNDGTVTFSSKNYFDILNMMHFCI